MLQDLIAISRSDELWKLEVQVNGTSQVGRLRVGLVDDGYNLMLRIKTGRSRCFGYLFFVLSWPQEYVLTGEMEPKWL